MEARLVVVHGDTKARQYDLHLPAIIGRSRSTDLMLGHPLVSRQHCQMFENNGTLMVRDLGSLNGTFVGEMRIGNEARPILPGDLFTIGPVTFQALYEDPQGRARDAAHDDARPWNSEGLTVDAPLGHDDGIRDTRAPLLPGNRRANDDTSVP